MTDGKLIEAADALEEGPKGTQAAEVGILHFGEVSRTGCSAVHLTNWVGAVRQVAVPSNFGLF